MVDFADKFPLPDLLSVLGDDVEFIDKNGGAVVSLKAIVRLALDRAAASSSYITEQQSSVELLKAHAPSLCRGCRIVHKNKTYEVDAIIADDGYTLTALIR